MEHERPFNNAEADRAFNRVLEAEARARGRIEGCRREAAELVEQAVARARRIEDRAEARLRRVHRLADASVERELRSLHTETAFNEDGLDAQALAHLDPVIERLADEILIWNAVCADWRVSASKKSPAGCLNPGARRCSGWSG